MRMMQSMSDVSAGHQQHGDWMGAPHKRPSQRPNDTLKAQPRELYAVLSYVHMGPSLCLSVCLSVCVGCIQPASILRPVELPRGPAVRPYAERITLLRTQQRYTG